MAFYIVAWCWLARPLRPVRAFHPRMLPIDRYEPHALLIVLAGGNVPAKVRFAHMHQRLQVRIRVPFGPTSALQNHAIVWYLQAADLLDP